MIYYLVPSIGIILVVALYIWRGKKISDHCEKKWLAISAWATFCAVLIALFMPLLQDLTMGPRLLILEPAYTDRFIRWIGHKNEINNEYYQDYSIDLELKNIGQSVAKDCQALLTAVADKTDTGWIPRSNWVPIGLRWVFEDSAHIATQYPEMVDLAPQRSYPFSLGIVSRYDCKNLVLTCHGILGGQSYQFPAGKEYCFEITVFSTNASTEVIYLLVNWIGYSKTDDITGFSTTENFKSKLIVDQQKHAPWSIRLGFFDKFHRIARKVSASLWPGWSGSEIP